MIRHTSTLLLFLLFSIAVLGCGKEENQPLSASECKQMLDKQKALLAPKLGGMLEGAAVTQLSFESDINCDAMDQNMKENGRDLYDCTMSSDSFEQVETCLAGKPRT